jgi:hypothetical protein
MWLHARLHLEFTLCPAGFGVLYTEYPPISASFLHSHVESLSRISHIRFTLPPHTSASEKKLLRLGLLLSSLHTPSLRDLRLKNIWPQSIYSAESLPNVEIHLPLLKQTGWIDERRSTSAHREGNGRHAECIYLSNRQYPLCFVSSSEAREALVITDMECDHLRTYLSCT